MAEQVSADPQALRKLAITRMPFGKYAGRFLVDLPEPYVVWLVRNNLPAGELGRQLLEIYEIKVNGLESLLRPLIPQSER
ncbi:MAG: DUF3820 family protein [Desulfuromonadales bacterium]|nr:DUF3820 family protein [Chloroflexota bacterium]MCK4691202.1 DUF3820 family protein [Desulfuromonadales bacterium]NOQ52649.1 hypothetical protein [Desulfuromonadaceae bacterium]OEU76054.1 MAG: hypothetical protein BA864_13265 [Desulfuromonadales bacterium C00003093]